MVFVYKISKLIICHYLQNQNPPNRKRSASNRCCGAAKSVFPAGKIFVPPRGNRKKRTGKIGRIFSRSGL
mgnify:CR=1 FL=1